MLKFEDRQILDLQSKQISLLIMLTEISDNKAL